MQCHGIVKSLAKGPGWNCIVTQIPAILSQLAHILSTTTAASKTMHQAEAATDDVGSMIRRLE